MLTVVAESPPMALDLDGGDRFDGPHRHRSGSLDARIAQLEEALRDLREQQGDVNRLRFTWKELAVVTGFCVGVVTANYASTAPIRTAVNEIHDQQIQQQNDAKLIDERMQTLREKVDGLTKAAELQKMKTDDLTNKVLDVMRRVR